MAFEFQYMSISKAMIVLDITRSFSLISAFDFIVVIIACHVIFQVPSCNSIMVSEI